MSIALLSGHDGKLPRSQQDVMQELLNTNNEVERTGKPASCDVETLQAYLTRVSQLECRDCCNEHLLNVPVVGESIVDRANWFGSSTNFKDSAQSCFVLC